jgi:hypothetical protein
MTRETRLQVAGGVILFSTLLVRASAAEEPPAPLNSRSSHASPSAAAIASVTACT